MVYWLSCINICKGSVTKGVWDQKKSCEFLNCGPQTDFWLFKLNVRPEQCFEHDMPDVHMVVKFKFNNPQLYTPSKFIEQIYHREL